MTLRDQLRAMVDPLPPGSSVTLPADWLRAQIEAEPETDGLAAADLPLEEFARRIRRATSTARTLCRRYQALLGAYKLNGRDWHVPAAGLRRYLDAQSRGELRDAAPRVASPRSRPRLGGWREEMGEAAGRGRRRRA